MSKVSVDLSAPSPYIEKDSPLTSEEKSLFAYFGEGAKIAPPFRIVNPGNVHIGDRTSIGARFGRTARLDLAEFPAETRKPR